jgi:hypothetical protein
MSTLVTNEFYAQPGRGEDVANPMVEILGESLQLEGLRRGSPSRVVRRNIGMSPAWSPASTIVRVRQRQAALAGLADQLGCHLLLSRQLGPFFSAISSSVAVVMSSLSRRAFGSAFQAGNTVSRTVLKCMGQRTFGVVHRARIFRVIVFELNRGATARVFYLSLGFVF